MRTPYTSQEAKLAVMSACHSGAYGRVRRISKNEPASLDPRDCSEVLLCILPQLGTKGDWREVIVAKHRVFFSCSVSRDRRNLLWYNFFF